MFFKLKLFFHKDICFLEKYSDKIGANRKHAQGNLCRYAVASAQEYD